MLPSKLGKLIKQARQSHAITLRELARRIDRSPAYIVSLERADEAPGISEDTLRSLSKELHLDYDSLLAAVRKTPEELAPRSATHVALYRLIQELPLHRQEELRRQLETEMKTRTHTNPKTGG
jgi:transcriptional regulator with XRE-family HTH domain